MRIAIIGYGKMGKTIERIAEERGHDVVLKIDLSNIDLLRSDQIKGYDIDIAIEFTSPHSAYDNITACFEAGIKVVSGSTAWLDKWDDAVQSMNKHKGSFIYASNFSVGVNIFFATLAQGIIAQNTKLENWKLKENGSSIAANELPIDAVRQDPAPGTHEILYSSVIDDIEIKHTAKSRNGFALGAVLAAEFLVNKEGLYTMNDVLDL